MEGGASAARVGRRALTPLVLSWLKLQVDGASSSPHLSCCFTWRTFVSSRLPVSPCPQRSILPCLQIHFARESSGVPRANGEGLTAQTGTHFSPPHFPATFIHLLSSRTLRNYGEGRARKEHQRRSGQQEVVPRTR